MYHSIEYICRQCGNKVWIDFRKPDATNYIKCCEFDMEPSGCERYNIKFAIEIGMSKNSH